MCHRLVGPNVVHNGSVTRDRHSKVSRAAKNPAADVAIFGCRAGRSAIAGVAGLGHEQVHHPVQLLLRVEVVVPVEDNGDTVLHQELVYGRGPARSVLRESF